VSVEQDDDRQAGAVKRCALEKPPAVFGLGYVKAVRDPVPLEQLADLVGAGRGMPADDSNELHTGAVHAGPIREELPDRRVQVDFGRRPGLVQIVLELTEGAALKDRRGGGPVPPCHQQAALRRRMDLVRATEELDPGHFGHPLVRNDERNLLGIGLDAFEVGKSGLRGEVRYDPVIPPEPSGQRIQERREGLRLIVHDHDDWFLQHDLLLLGEPTTVCRC
jgi:hypothetical protein